MDASNPHHGRPPSSEGGRPRRHIHAYRWTGDRRTYDQEGPRRPESPAFAANRCTPILIANWLLRPASAITATFHDIDDAVRWFEEQMTHAAPGFASPQEGEPARLAAKVAHVAATLRRGRDAHAAWYIQATGYTTLDLITCSPNRGGPGFSCPGAESAAPARSWPPRSAR
ncbi:hypothetical protein [Streptomyces millisiae]|uniref:Uncharacterized protein n=1 Tax=Streptomyces millisiae TaxID=3075542 RepID=A0ABU2LTD8_9ACTN|nr:hypothetical protein [Streptomyces sp. DSM 44918]MDT0320323.1 hypothetical protein [Streptomyces sp. DSM 44918]